MPEYDRAREVEAWRNGVYLGSYDVPVQITESVSAVLEERYWYSPDDEGQVQGGYRTIAILQVCSEEWTGRLP